VIGATVVITVVERGVSRTLSMDNAGDYLAPDIPPGLYKLSFTSAGFNGVERPNIRMEAARDVRIDCEPKPGDVNETITVTEEIPLVESTNVVLGGTLSNATINDLPLNGRDFQNLLVVRPGVMRYRGGGIGSVSANGIRPEDNNYMVDGIDNQRPVLRPKRHQWFWCAGNSSDNLTHRPHNCLRRPFRLQKARP
jgi:hypothetical protein